MTGVQTCALPIYKPLYGDEIAFKRNHIKNHENVAIDIYNGMEQSLTEMNTQCTKATSLVKVFNNVSEPIYFDDVHVVDHGNEIIAKNLFNEILPFIPKKFYD